MHLGTLQPREAVLPVRRLQIASRGFDQHDHFGVRAVRECKHTAVVNLGGWIAVAMDGLFQKPQFKPGMGTREIPRN